jgi:hypothetical protein
MACIAVTLRSSASFRAYAETIPPHKEIECIVADSSFIGPFHILGAGDASAVARLPGCLLPLVCVLLLYKHLGGIKGGNSSATAEV